MKLRSSMMVAITAFGLASASFGTAQTVQPPLEQSANAYSDTDLRQFAAAVVEVQRITDTYIPQLRSAASAEERDLVHAAASVEMTRAVEKEGMSPEKFHDILSLARADPGVAARIRAHILQPE